MNTFKFAGLPSNSAVASAVTLAVSAWFLVAGAAMLTEKPGALSEDAAAATTAIYSAPAVSIAPEARLIIVVEGRRA